MLDHEPQINSPWVLTVDKDLIPTGKFLAVKNTPFDFIDFHGIGARINDDNPQITNGHGYDHCWIINSAVGGKVVPAATLYEPKSGRMLEVWSDQMGLQFYSGNFFNGETQGKWGKHLYRGAVALETQKFPDAIHQASFSDKPVLNPGEQYTQTCIYKFSVKR